MPTLHLLIYFDQIFVNSSSSSIYPSHITVKGKFRLVDWNGDIFHFTKPQYK